MCGQPLRQYPPPQSALKILTGTSMSRRSAVTDCRAYILTSKPQSTLRSLIAIAS